MERLGLWGEGTHSFAAFQDFLDAVGGRGVGALELVAMDMKARGMFVCRTLSFQGARALQPHHTRFSEPNWAMPVHGSTQSTPPDLPPGFCLGKYLFRAPV